MFFNIKSIAISLFILTCASCGVSGNSAVSWSQRVIVEPDQIHYTLRLANDTDGVNQSLYDLSVAQVVFPKILKAGLLFGGTYGEGYLVRDGIILSQVRLAGGNAGLNVGAQSYSQVVYILDDDTLAAFRRGGKVSLHGTLNYARRGASVTNTFGKLSPTQPLYTTIFNQSGYLAGVSLDGNFMQLMR